MLAAACSTGGAARPNPGPAAGPVSIHVSTQPAPGVTVVVTLDDRQQPVGSACATIDRWEGGTWRSLWWWLRTSPVAEPIARGQEVTCPAIGVLLPATMTLALPDDLAAGTWRVAYAGGDDLGAYVFEVG